MFLTHNPTLLITMSCFINLFPWMDKTAEFTSVRLVIRRSPQSTLEWVQGRDSVVGRLCRFVSRLYEIKEAIISPKSIASIIPTRLTYPPPHPWLSQSADIVFGVVQLYCIAVKVPRWGREELVLRGRIRGTVASTIILWINTLWFP
jgi:hypothetical protein